MTVRAPVVHRDRPALAIEPKNEVPAEEREGLWAILKEDLRNDRVPELPGQGLLGYQHGGLGSRGPGPVAVGNSLEPGHAPVNLGADSVLVLPDE